jgi:serine/threonine protein kinase
MHKPLRFQCVGPYELLAQIGLGGMGTVFKARHKTTGSIVAVKVASKRVAQHPTLCKRFRTDYEVASQLAHSNLVRALDYGVEDGTPYLVMELVEGQSLDQRLKTKGPLSEAEAVAVFVQVGQALHFLHEANILHRDIKPGNILIADTGEAKLADFGLGKDLDSDSVLTRSHMGLGTVEYAAPEQFEDAKHVDQRCDLYSLGVTLYVALTGSFPFGRGSLFRVLQKKAANQFAPLSQVLPTIAPAIDRLVGLAMQAEVRSRPSSCQEFLAALQGQRPPPVAPPTPTPAVPQKFEERRQSVRFAIQLNSSCQPLAGAQWWDATITDASIHGLCLQLGRRLEPKTILQVALISEPDSNPNVLVQTRWVRQQTDRTWLIGCAFVTPLSEADLERLLISGSEPTRLDGLPP